MYMYSSVLKTHFFFHDSDRLPPRKVFLVGQGLNPSAKPQKSVSLLAVQYVAIAKSIDGPKHSFTSLFVKLEWICYTQVVGL